MKTFLIFGGVMFSPAFVQSVEKEYNTSCIITFDNGRRLRVAASYPEVCQKIKESFFESNQPSIANGNISVREEDNVYGC